MTGLLPSRAPAHRMPHGADRLLRGLIALSLLVSAYVHLKLWLDAFDSIKWIGPLFMLNVVAGVVLALAVMLWRHWLPLLGAIGFGLSTLVAFVLSATVGLLGVHETWTGWTQITAGIAELVTVVAGLAALRREQAR